MFGSLIVYSGLLVATAGLGLSLRPIRRIHLMRRVHGLAVAAAGALLAVSGLMAPASESRVERVETRLDEFAPRWQFRERHELSIAAPPARVFAAIKSVRADEIPLFRALTWIRRGGRPLPRSILNAGDEEPLIDVATSSGFALLADDPPRELVIATVVLAPPDEPMTVTPQAFRWPLPPGFALATMNFLVTPNGPDAAFVSTETRVFAQGVAARRRFAAYWRIIYPGSSIIRCMWLRAIRERATSPDGR